MRTKQCKCWEMVLMFCLNSTPKEIPDAEGPCPQLALIGNEELPYCQWLGRETEGGTFGLHWQGTVGKREENCHDGGAEI